jgi:hypothetical protein
VAVYFACHVCHNAEERQISDDDIPIQNVTYLVCKYHDSIITLTPQGTTHTLKGEEEKGGEGGGKRGRREGKGGEGGGKVKEEREEGVGRGEEGEGRVGKGREEEGRGRKEERDDVCVCKGKIRRPQERSKDG